MSKELIQIIGYLPFLYVMVTIDKNNDKKRQISFDIHGVLNSLKYNIFTIDKENLYLTEEFGRHL